MFYKEKSYILQNTESHRKLQKSRRKGGLLFHASQLAKKVFCSKEKDKQTVRKNQHHREQELGKLQTLWNDAVAVNREKKEVGINLIS